MVRALLRWLGMLAGWAELVPLTGLLWLLAFLPLPRRIYRALFHHWSRVWVAALGVELRLHQHNLHPLPPVYLMIANHPSAFEDIGIPALFDVDSLAKAEVRHWPIVGRISAAAGTLYVRRESRESRREAAQAIRRHLEGGRSVALYPEGGVKGMRVHPFRYGAFAISLDTGIPIVPVFIHYEAQRDFYWDREPLPLKLWQIMRAANPVANYHLFDAVDPAEFTDKESYCAALQQRYREWQARYLD